MDDSRQASENGIFDHEFWKKAYDQKKHLAPPSGCTTELVKRKLPEIEGSF